MRHIHPTRQTLQHLVTRPLHHTTPRIDDRDRVHQLQQLWPMRGQQYSAPRQPLAQHGHHAGLGVLIHVRCWLIQEHELRIAQHFAIAAQRLTQPADVAVAGAQTDQLGDITTMADSGVIVELIAKVEKLLGPAPK